MDVKLFVFGHLAPWILACVTKIGVETGHPAGAAIAANLTGAWETLWVPALLRFLLALAVLIGLERLDSRFHSH